MQEPLVTNAANEKQIKKAKRVEKSLEDQSIQDMRKLLALPEGQRFILRLFSYCGVMDKVWRPNAQIHEATGRHDVGIELYKFCVEADPARTVKIMTESLKESLNKVNNETKKGD